MPLIIISGNIGSGKSTFSAALARTMRARHLREDPDEYVFLSDFYQDMSRWAFYNQLQFVVRKFDQQQHTFDCKDLVIQDGSAYESFGVFVRKFRDDGFIGEREFQTFSDLYRLLEAVVSPPDLLVHLTAPVSVLLQRIEARGRDYERGISAAYLSDLDSRYGRWVDTFMACPVLRIDAIAAMASREDAPTESIVRLIERALASGTQLSADLQRLRHRQSAQVLLAT